jgi:hypothetical protein
MVPASKFDILYSKVQFFCLYQIFTIGKGYLKTGPSFLRGIATDGSISINTLSVIITLEFVREGSEIYAAIGAVQKRASRKGKNGRA